MESFVQIESLTRHEAQRDSLGPETISSYSAERNAKLKHPCPCRFGLLEARLIIVLFFGGVTKLD